MNEKKNSFRASAEDLMNSSEILPKDENQNVEYKESWHDEYLKWLCGFANAQGGELYIGIRDDGSVCGVNDAKRLLEEIPNKAVQLLGVVVDADLLTNDGCDVIRIRVNSYSVPISYRGTYHYRSGATKQELTGTALQDFLFRKMGLSWDDVECVGAKLDDIDDKAIRYFLRHAIASGRMPAEAEELNKEELIKGLGLMTDSGVLKNAAVLLFGKFPQRRFAGAQFKIGRFGADESDLMFQDLIEGNILQMADRVVDCLRAKYLINPISYRGLQRIESFELPEDAFREALFNAIIHRNYAGPAIQLKVWRDRLELWNDGPLPIGFTEEDLHAPHSSHPRNKNIASVFYRAGFIEAWGRGINKITKGFTAAKLPVPIFTSHCGGVLTTVMRPIADRGIESGEKPDEGNHTENHTENHTVNTCNTILEIIGNDPYVTIARLCALTGKSRPTINEHIANLKAKNRIRRIGPDKGGHWEVVI